MTNGIDQLLPVQATWRVDRQDSAANQEQRRRRAQKPIPNPFDEDEPEEELPTFDDLA